MVMYNQWYWPPQPSSPSSPSSSSSWIVSQIISTSLKFRLFPPLSPPRPYLHCDVAAAVARSRVPSQPAMGVMMNYQPKPMRYIKLVRQSVSKSSIYIPYPRPITENYSNVVFEDSEISRIWDQTSVGWKKNADLDSLLLNLVLRQLRRSLQHALHHDTHRLSHQDHS